MSSRMLTSDEVMNVLNISRHTLSQWIKKRKLKGKKIGSRWTFEEGDILDLKRSEFRPSEIYDDMLLKRNLVVKKILSKSIKIDGLTSSDLVRIAREK